VLDLSKIEAGNMDVYLEDVELPAFVDGVAKAMGPLVDKKNNELCIELGDDLVPAYTDLTKVRQCIVNLVGNAAKFTENGTITIRVRQSEVDGESLTAIDVADTGIGMTPLQQSRVFQPFTQADNSTTRRFGGTGMGLALVKNMIEMVGGTVSVTSELHRGSTFTLVFPTQGTDDIQADDQLVAAK
jgi:signal transduction histidine kinase